MEENNIQIENTKEVQAKEVEAKETEFCSCGESVIEGSCIQANYNFGLEDSFFLEDIENRHLFLDTVIDEEVISSVVYHILRYNMEDYGLDVEDRKPIYLYINSPGGDIDHGLSVVDTISMSKTPVYTVNIGGCYSMAMVVFIAGKKRYALPHSQFLMHDGETGGMDSTAKMRDRIEFESNVLNKSIKEFIVKHTSISDELYDEKYRVEWYFMASEAKDLGVTDYIIGEDCSIDDIL